MEKVKHLPMIESLMVDVVNNLYNPYLDKWRASGGKIMGYYCSYVPEELLSAAGFMPFRIRAGRNPSVTKADAHMTTLSCDFVRHSYDLAMKGEFHFLDGLLFANTCDHARRVYDNCKWFVEQPQFIQILSVPRRQGEDQKRW